MHPEDVTAITDVLLAYCDAVDACDADAVAALFTEDASMDFGLGRVFHGRQAVRELVAGRMSRYRGTSHHLSNVRVASPGQADEANARSYVYAWHERADGTQAEIWGRYADRLVRDGGDGRWRIATRSVRAAGWRGFPVGPAGEEPFERIPRLGG